MKLLLVLTLLSAALVAGCTPKVERVEVPVEPTPCRLPKWPAAPQVTIVPIDEDEDGTPEFVIFPPESIALIAGWVEAAADWYEAAIDCPYVAVDETVKEALTRAVSR